MPWNVDALVAGFTEDCVVRFGVIPEFRGREALRKFFEARRAEQTGYRLDKQFRTLVDDVMTNVWEGEWEDAGTGQRMKGFGVEVWIMRDGQIATWEAAFNAGSNDRDRGCQPGFALKIGTSRLSEGLRPTRGRAAAACRIERLLKSWRRRLQLSRAE